MHEFILLVEDDSEEQKHAKEVLWAQGFRVAVAGTRRDAKRIWENLGQSLCGCLTDLHIPEGGRYDKASDVSAPRGLWVVAKAVQQPLPVVICSDVDHHGAEYLVEVVRALERLYPCSRIPFIMDRKDWERAARELRELVNEKALLEGGT
ncbi:MAG: hypothetical protein Q8R13_03950 [bacterium]|nr:hypothetical protein [bacterium]MDZ4295975.1 hypothetical protein [Patescibacteria group bacterium]